MPEDEEKQRKSLEERGQMSDIDRLRHSCAHVMATAILRIWPDAQFAAGPPDETKYEDFSPLLRDILSRGLREARQKAQKVKA